MANKYLTLEEAAQQLSISKEELMRLREKGEIRGFADRGTWKFRGEDVQTLARQRQMDSDPEAQIYARESSDSDVRLVSDSGLISDSGISSTSDLAGHAVDSDSDVKLVETAGDEDSDSDVKMIEDDSDSDVKMVEDDSDSDVKMVGDDSDSDVKIVPGADSDSDITIAPPVGKKRTDSDVKLVGDDSGSDISLAPGPDDKTERDIRLVGSESDVRLVDPTEEGTSDSDISLVRSGDSAVSVDLGSSDDSGAIVLSDESGIALTEDSSMTLAAESGISLEAPADSGISLDLTEEGITLAGDSGIALSPIDDDTGKTMPMMDSATGDSGSGTQFEIPSIMDDDDADFDFDAPSGEEDTGVFSLSDDHTDEQTALVEALDDSGEFDDGEFALDESGELSDELDFESDFDSGTVEELDVFEEEEGEFEEGFTSGVSHADFASPVARTAPVETDWGTGPFVGLLLSTGLLIVVGVVMFDLVQSMWRWNEPGPLSSMVLSALSGLYGSGS